MSTYELIKRKRDGLELTPPELDELVSGVVSGTVPDYQLAAWLMAVYFQGMTSAETAALTKAMVRSGECLDLSGIPGLKVDKHSTGGVGDKTTLVVAPLVAATGVPVAKMSGRGLGHTGGTLDKLESFPGLKVELTQDHFLSQVRRIGLAIAGQTADLAPADKHLYALRDVTATVDSVPLIAASVMSKKIASGASAFVLDVKTGRGAFMRDEDEARILARAMVDIAVQHGRRAVALLTSMSQPLGQTVGNALEVKEALDTLRGAGPRDLRELCLALAAEMLVLAEAAPDLEAAHSTLDRVLSSGAALEKLAQMVGAQGGDPTAVFDSSRLPQALVVADVISPAAGYVRSIDALEIGLAAVSLGAGRLTKDDPVDLAVGITLLHKVGSRVERGEAVATVHAQSVESARVASKRVLDAFTLGPRAPQLSQLVLDRIAGL